MLTLRDYQGTVPHHAPLSMEFLWQEQLDDWTSSAKPSQPRIEIASHVFELARVVSTTSNICKFQLSNIPKSNHLTALFVQICNAHEIVKYAFLLSNNTTSEKSCRFLLFDLF